MVASPLLDRYLGRTGFSGQQDDEPVEPGRRDNLWEPVPGDHGAHGRFDAEARRWSPQLWATTHRGWVAGAGAVLAGVAGLTLARRAPRA